MKNKEKNIVNIDEIELDVIPERKSGIKKKLMTVFYIFLFLIVIIVFPIFFYEKEVNQNLLSLQYKKGAFHVHSVFSDGTGSLEEISNAAKKNKLDFVLMTDHGRPNVKCSDSTGWKNKILMIGGSEFSLNCGHLAAAGFGFNEKKDYIFPPEPQEAINDINKTNGISFISHPLDGRIPWTDWDVKNFTGIEILNSYSSAKKTSILNIFIFPLQYLFDKKYALLNTISYPENNLNLWDDFNKRGEYLGIYALDAHAKIQVSKNFKFKWPSYQAMFEIFKVYVKVDEEFKSDPDYSAGLIISSIRKGNFFSVIEAIAPANGFEMLFVGKNGKKYEMGSKISSVEGEILIKLPFTFNTDIIIKKDGKLFKKISNNHKKELRINIEKKGVYRVEVFVSDNKFNKLPWILTNPLFIGDNATKTKNNINPEIKKPFTIYDNSFKIEKNDLSEGNLHIKNDENGKIIQMDYHLKKSNTKIDFWVALAYRKKIDFKGYSGIIFNTRSDSSKRFWFELRSENDISYRHSFLSTNEWQKVFIPFNKLHAVSGDSIVLDHSRISALFFSLNNAISYDNKKGNLEIRGIGLY